MSYIKVAWLLDPEGLSVVKHDEQACVVEHEGGGQWALEAALARLIVRHGHGRQEQTLGDLTLVPRVNAAGEQKLHMMKI